VNALKDLLRGIRRHPLTTGGHIFVAFSVLWTITEALSYFVPGIIIKGPIALWALIVIGILYGLKKVWKPSKVAIDIKHTNTCIIVLFGDLFQQDGVKAVAVNDFFDSKLGKPVSENSVHGKFINLCFGGYSEAFDKQIKANLKDVAPIEVVEREEGKSHRYPIGSTAFLTADAGNYIAVALTETDVASSKVSADVTMMWIALHSLWQRARVECGGAPLNVPLIGSGLSGLGLPTRDLLNLIILSAINETKEKAITNTIRIVLARDRYDEVDLRDVKRHWER
jgi:Thoeris protein ThsA, Macro domain